MHLIETFIYVNHFICFVNTQLLQDGAVKSNLFYSAAACLSSLLEFIPGLISQNPVLTLWLWSLFT